MLAGLVAAIGCSSSNQSGEPAPKAEPVARETSAGEGAADRVAAPAVTGLGKAPAFTLPDQDGKPVSLASFAGKTVVLEWFNPGCPFVRYAHGEGPLADQAKRVTERGVVWLAINSSAPGKEGHGVADNVEAATRWGMAHPILFDEDGAVGRQYGAKTTPHMYVIDPQGNLVYRGAIDNAPMGNLDGDTAVNFVDEALAALTAGRPVATPERKSYGCSVKYAN
jgi:peroxiredoxin